MELRIKQTPGDDGAFEVQQVQIVTIGRFCEKAHAELFCSAMIDQLDAGPAAELPQNPPDGGVTAHKASTDAAAPNAHTSAVGETGDTAPGNWSEKELQGAFVMLAAGSAVKDVAARYGRSWTVLRAKWASNKQRARTFAPAPAKSENAALPTVGSLPGTHRETCSICQKEFAATADNLDTCARCRHGA
ncbi:MAG: hypothetical protein OIF47_00470 [Marinibacterium sp.]|nr:hypothetical protein [Marinibacterium sp.]